MPDAAVQILVTDSENPANPVSGVRVGIYEEDDTFLTSETTNAEGIADFQLDGEADPGTLYKVRFFKQDVSGFANPHTIYVVAPEDPEDPNEYTATCSPHVLPQAPDANYCRCSATFIDASGHALEERTVLLIRPQSLLNSSAWPGDPTGVGDRVVTFDEVNLRTDHHGYAEVDLPRGGTFYAQVAGLGDRVATLVIPDAPAANLLDLLYPVPASMAFTPEEVTVAAGAVEEVDIVLFTSDGQEAANLASVEYEIGDEDVLSAVLAGLTIRITGVSPGETTITFTPREGSYPSRVPETTLTGGVLTVLVQ